MERICGDSSWKAATVSSRKWDDNIETDTMKYVMREGDACN
jgi:hypothetical protein